MTPTPTPEQIEKMAKEIAVHFTTDSRYFSAFVTVYITAYTAALELVKERDKEIERLKGLIETAFNYAKANRFSRFPEQVWNKFKTNNNL